MLTDQEIEAIATAYVQSTEAEMQKESSRSSLKLRLVKHFALDEPAGTYFTYEPTTGERLCGPGGFFVERTLGRVTSFGSGEFLQAARELNAASMKMGFEQAVVTEMLRRRRN